MTLDDERTQLDLDLYSCLPIPIEYSRNRTAIDSGNARAEWSKAIPVSTQVSLFDVLRGLDVYRKSFDTVQQFDQDI